MIEQHMSLYDLINIYIKPEYKEAARLILTGNKYQQQPWDLWFTNDELSSIRIMSMVDDSPHTIEYVNWDALYRAAPFVIREHEIDGFSGIGYSINLFIMEDDTPTKIKDYIIANYQCLEYNIIPYKDEEIKDGLGFSTKSGMKFKYHLRWK